MSSKSSKTDTGPLPPERILVGRVRRPHGLRGEIVIDVLSDVPDRFAAGSGLLLVDPRGSVRSVRVVSCRVRTSGAILMLEGTRTRDDADLLRGCTLEIERSEVRPASEGSYYVFDLVGCECRDLSSGLLGRVAEIVEDGGGILLKIEQEGRELLVPFAKVFLRSVSIEEKRIELDLPDGLIEVCASQS